MPLDDALTSTWTQFGLAGLLALTLVWFLRHLVTTTIPDLVREFKESTERDRSFFRTLLEEDRARCAAEHKELLDEIKVQRQILLDALRKE